MSDETRTDSPKSSEDKQAEELIAFASIPIFLAFWSYFPAEGWCIGLFIGGGIFLTQLNDGKSTREAAKNALACVGVSTVAMFLFALIFGPVITNFFREWLLSS